MAPVMSENPRKAGNVPWAGEQCRGSSISVYFPDVWPTSGNPAQVRTGAEVEGSSPSGVSRRPFALLSP